MNVLGVLVTPTGTLHIPALRSGLTKQYARDGYRSTGIDSLFACYRELTDAMSKAQILAASGAKHL